MAPANKKDLREVKDGLVGAVAHQAAIMGLEPNVQAAERFLAPIIRKVEVDQALADSKPIPSPPEPRKPKTGTYHAGEWIGDAGSSPKVPDGFKVEVGPPKTVKWNLRTNDIEGMPKPRPESSRMAAARECFRVMRLMPEWRHVVEKVWFAPMRPEEKEKRLAQVLNNFRRLFGDPRKPLGTKVSVG